jgi:hypothetical protein
MNTCNTVDRNNRAIVLLRQGKHKQAAALLRTVIADLKDRFVVHEQGPPSSLGTDAASSSACTSVNGEGDDEDYSSMKQDKPSIISVPLWTEESLEQKDDKTLIFMYAQALVLARVDHCKETLTAVVLYNMALANHARAIEKHTSSDLTVALKFYGLAVAIIQGQNDVGVNAFTHWLLLALYSNMAQIYFSQACSGKLRHCLGNIRALLASDRIGQVVGGEDYAFFWTNTIFEVSAVAASAA